MGLTCSVLGHQYGDRERIEEQDRQGSEEIIAVREVKTCVRCGEELVVSESKEVLAVPGEEDAGQEPEEPVTDTIPDAEPSSEPSPPPEPQTSTEAESAEEDDGVILSDDGEREPGAWPPMEDESDEEEASPPEDGEADWPELEVEEAASTEDQSDPDPWPEVTEEDEGYDAVAGDIDPELAEQVIEAAPSGQEEVVEAEETDAGFVRASPIGSPADPDESDVNTEFYCPRCDWGAESLSTSVRRGDICPECRTGYIAERDPS